MCTCMCSQTRMRAHMCDCICSKTHMSAVYVFVCANKLICTLIYALVCAPKIVWLIVCAPKFVCKKRKKRSTTPLYLTPWTPSSLTLVPQSMALNHNCRVSWPLAFSPLAITILSHHSFACRWRLWMPAAIESLLIKIHTLSLIVRPYADSFKFSYTTTIFYQSIKLLPKKLIFKNRST